MWWLLEAAYHLVEIRQEGHRAEGDNGEMTQSEKNVVSYSGTVEEGVSY